MNKCPLIIFFFSSFKSILSILKDGEQVEFEVITEPNGRSKAFNVTGPDGSYVQGAPKRFNNDGFGHDDRGY